MDRVGPGLWPDLSDAPNDFSRGASGRWGSRRPLVITIFIGLGSASIIAPIAAILTGLPHPAAAYATALLVNFLGLAFFFVAALEVILRQEDASGSA